MANNNKQKGPAYVQPDHIKPKSKWTKTATIWTIIIVIVVLGILAIIGANNGWFKSADMINGKIVLEDYSTIEVPKADVEVSDTITDSLISSIVSANTTKQSISCFIQAFEYPSFAG